MNSKSVFLLSTFVSLFASIALVGCDSSAPGTSGDPKKEGGSTSTAASVDSKGSSFIKPFLENVFDDYKKSSGFFVNYQGGGSGAGIQALIDGTVPIAFSDAMMNDEELGKAASGKVGKVVQFPVVVGALAIVYNAPDLKTPLNLDAQVISDIFQLKIKKWNDAKIAALNPGVALPDADIVPIVRADSSGSTYVFSDFLSKANVGWSLGTNKQITWNSEIRQEPKSDGVSKGVADTPASITYVELAYAKKANMQTASIKNSAGKFLMPDAAGVTAAASEGLKADPTGKSIVMAAGEASYPISTFVFALIPENLEANKDGKKIVDALKFVCADGQKQAEQLFYAPLPESVQKSAATALSTIKVK